MDQFTYLDSNISSTTSGINIHQEKEWNAIDRLLITRKSNLSYKIKLDLFQAVAVSILLYRSTSWTLPKCKAENTRMQHAVLKTSWKQHPTKELLYDHLLFISKPFAR